MAEFKDRNGTSWTVQLDAPLIEDIEAKHSVNLVDLEKDPLVKLRNNPMILGAVMYLICEDQIKERELDPRGFARLCPQPPDEMLDAVREAIIDFFPSGRASHVREVLTKYEEMAAKVDALTMAKMQSTISDEKLLERLRKHGDLIFDQEINSIFQSSSKHGT